MAAGTLGNFVLPGGTAMAADYKALVCIFLYGGNDGLNTIVPTDAERYGQYSAVRKAIALPRDSLLAMSDSQFGLHPSLAALQTSWKAKRLAPVFNLGPLRAPLTKAAYLSATQGSSLIPSNLFSHSDQQILWETGSSSALARTGWGGRAADAMATTNPVISVGGNGRFGLSNGGVPTVIPGPGGFFGVHELGVNAYRLQYEPMRARASTLRSMYRQLQASDLGDAYTKLQRDAFDTADRLGAIVKSQPGDADANPAINAGFAPLISGGKITTALGQQLYQAAKLIANNTLVQGTRQIFFAQMGGFDTHASQASANPVLGTHANLLKQLGDAMAAFDAALSNLGLSNAVTTFTQSDFGRTFKPNSSNGTDHAWGNTHLVMGGAVKGGTTYGTYPSLVLGGSDDVTASGGEGRWIPTSSVDQYAATLLRWFGANEGQLDSILPNLVNFGSARQLGFV